MSRLQSGARPPESKHDCRDVNWAHLLHPRSFCGAEPQILKILEDILPQLSLHSLCKHNQLPEDKGGPTVPKIRSHQIAGFAILFTWLCLKRSRNFPGHLVGLIVIFPPKIGGVAQIQSYVREPSLASRRGQSAIGPAGRQRCARCFMCRFRKRGLHLASRGRSQLP